MRLLLAEPTRAIGDLVSYICEAEGVECDVARDVDSLFTYLKEETFDVLCLAPNIDSEEGIGVLKQIRALPNFSYIPIFLFTASPDNQLSRRALASGATDLISKSDFDGLTFFLRRHQEEQRDLDARVLLVEDSQTQQKLFTSLLREIGCEVVVCECAHDAFEVYKKHKFDLVVTDIVLEGVLSGVALAGRIRRLGPIIGDVPILAITGYDDPSREASLFSYGVNDYLTKPVDGVRFCRQAKNFVRAFQLYKKLEEKRLVLAESDRKRIQFWANLSHELRTPLNGVIGAAQLLDDEDVTESKRECLSIIKNSSSMLLSLINDVLSLTKAESGELKFSPKNVELEETLRQAINVVKTMACEKDLNLTITLAPNTPKIIECDLIRFNQVLVNLLHNAIKFTEKGEITVSCRLIDKGEPLLKFCVSDSGIGIAQEEQVKIFKKFKQANDKIEDQYGGTGIGLHLTKLIVTMWHGEIGVHSKQGEGSQFWFTMPLRHGVEVMKDTGVFLTCENPINKRILVVDDIEMNIMITQGMLKEMGFKVDVALTSEVAMEKVKQKLYDCVLLDYQLPDINGAELTNKIRSLSSEHEEIPVIALTTQTYKDFKKTHQKAGAVDIMEKPIELPRLVEVLNKHIK